MTARTATRLTGYQSGIAAATGLTDEAVIDQVEELMRSEYRTLDHLTARQFASAARRWHGYLEATAQGEVTRNVGDLVGCSRRPGVTYKILKVNGESYRLENVATGQSLRASKSLVTDPPAAAQTPAEEYRSIVESLETAETAHMPLGTLARWVGPKAAGGIKVGELCVIIRISGDKFNAAKLGGCDDRYISGAHRRYFQVVDPATLAL